MLINIIVFLLSIVPTVLIFLWLRNRKKDDREYGKCANSAFIRGLISTFPIVGVSLFLYIILRLTHLEDNNVLLYNVLYKVVVLALSEELVKFFAFRGLLKKKSYEYTWADVAAFMTIVGLAFGLAEDIPYAVGAAPMVMLVRGFTMGHVGYGFIMGWFYGKRLQIGKKLYGVIAIILPWILHGLYDFSLTPELIEINENFMFIGLALAVLEIVLLVLMIRFFIRARKKEIYNQALPTLTITFMYFLTFFNSF